MAIYFFSDVHLGASDKANEDLKLAKLYTLLDKIRVDGRKVFILGDLFDFWFEYKHAIPKEHLKVVFRLAQLIEEGIEIHYISGNHDFWLGEYLSREVKIIIHRDYFETTEDGKKIFMIHGDGLSPSDWKYRILKKILRNRINIWLYQKVPPDWGIPLARYVSGSSRTYTKDRPADFIKDYEKYAAHKIASGYDYVLIGHTHYPSRLEFGSGVYLNTGDFIENFSYGKLVEGKLTLEGI